MAGITEAGKDGANICMTVSLNLATEPHTISHPPHLKTK